MKQQIDEITEQEGKKVITSFEEFVNKHTQDGYWKSIDDIVDISGSTAPNVRNVIKSFDEFIENDNDEYTTVRMYEKYTPFWKKIRNTAKGIVR
jgi:hypothetical protein